MSDSSHKRDRYVKITEGDELIYNVHEYDIDIKSKQLYLMGNEAYVSGHEEAADEPGVDYTMANRFIRNLNIMMRSTKTEAEPILIHMKTCGGDWQEGMAIYDAIRSCPNPITILCYTHARSMSSIILQAANKRVMMPHSVFMYHEGDNALAGTTKQIRTWAEWEEKTGSQMTDIYINSMKRTGKYKNRSKKWLLNYLHSEMDKKEDVFLTAEEAVLYGFADEIFGGDGTYDWTKLLEYTDEQLTR